MTGLLLAGTTSDAGKSLLTAGICRWLVRRGVRVAPFKSQNMSNNSMVCPDGAEIGRAQWVQAVAARVVPEAAMNPVLLKPGSDRRSHVVLLGQPHGELGTGEWATGRRELARAAFAAYEDLASRFDVVVAEGAGSAAEVNLRSGDYVNLGLARAMGLPVVVVGDIDRGGVLAAMYGTWALVDEADRAHFAGWIVNKFRGDVDLLRPGLEIVTERTGLPVLGVVPWLEGAWLDGEDALALGGWSRAVDAHEAAAGTLRVAVVGLPRLSNATDVDALAAEPGVDVTVTADPAVVAGADLAVLPGSRATLSDLRWLRERGLDEAVAARARRGAPVLGICGGYQMLAERIVDPSGVEAAGGERESAGLGLLPTRVDFGEEKVLGTPVGAWHGHEVRAYEIHHGVASLVADATSDDGRDDGFRESVAPFLDGWQQGATYGTTWHGAFENDDFRRAFLTEVAHRSGSGFEVSTSAPGFAARREAMIERLGDAVEEHLDTDALLALLGL
ncbi:cobyric acid synthase [Mobilicoccus pelagius]|uniref:Cobyric acid synthase n=1 Tax=Mobilicoccus pelagius NBRC 104925 TaxID=1089455 RepID=H5UQ63_9MICO|nr:cobyric acid synthase [Mobilicoccus pelagius]GAB47868.1 cobyric acid synthase [Mobilicoccus pelagius NBRC 104925]